jgi:hypothetical protein
MTRKFKDFTIEYLLESVLEVSPEFKKIISNIKTSSGLERYIVDWVNSRSDIKTNYNLLGPGDSSDKILYLQDRQYQRFKETGVDISTRTKIDSNVGRLVRSILSDNGIKFTEPQVEEFVNGYKSEWNRIYNPREFDIVRGEDIRFWYLEKNYYRGGQSSLGNSCMRYENKNNRLGIYTDNPDKVSMMIFTDYEPGSDAKKLLARALIWKTDSGKIYCDRIYANSDEIHAECKSWLKSKYPGASFYAESPEKIFVTLNKVLFDKYPYVDSLQYLVIPLVDDKLDTSNGFMTNVLADERRRPDYPGVTFHLRDHISGSRAPQYHRYWPSEDKWYHKDEIVQTYPSGEEVPKKHTVWSEIYRKYIRQVQSVWSEFQKSNIYLPHSLEVEGYGIVDKNMIIRALDVYKGDPREYPWQKWDICKKIDSSNLTQSVLPKQLSGVKKYFKPEYSSTNWFVREAEFWLAKHSVRNADGKRVPELFTIPAYEINIANIRKALKASAGSLTGLYLWNFSIIQNLLYYNTKGVCFILEEDAEIFGLTRYLGKQTCFSPDIYYKLGNYISSDLMNLLIEECDQLTPSQKSFRISLDRWSKETFPPNKVKFTDYYESDEFYKKINSYIETECRNFRELIQSINIVSRFEIYCSGRGRSIPGVSQEDLPQFLRDNIEDLMRVYYWFHMLYTGNSNVTARIILEELEHIDNGIIRDLEKTKKIIHHFVGFWVNSPGGIREKSVNMRSLKLGIEDIKRYKPFVVNSRCSW